MCSVVFPAFLLNWTWKLFHISRQTVIFLVVNNLPSCSVLVLILLCPISNPMPSPYLLFFFVSTTSSLEGWPFPDGALHAAPCAHHADKCQCHGWRRLLLSALHRCYAPSGGNTVGFGAARDANGRGEAGSSGRRWRGAYLCFPEEQACY